MTVMAASAPRGRCAVSLDLSRGWHPASARIEWFESDSPAGMSAGQPTAEASVWLHGWIDRPALEGLEATLDQVVARGVRRLMLDCSGVRHVEFTAVPALTRMLFRVATGGLSLRGLSPHLRDLFRLAGCQELVPSVFAAIRPAKQTPAGAGHEWSA
jgi:anti-anti-sigma regulatory factor